MESIWKGLAAILALCVAFIFGTLLLRTPAGHDGEFSYGDGWWPDLDHEAGGRDRRLRHTAAFENDTIPSRAKLEDFVRIHYPWVIRNRLLPNYVLNGSLRTKTDRRRRGPYVDGIKVFVHLPRTCGTALVGCIRDLMSNSSAFREPPPLTEAFRERWDSPDGLNQQYRHRFDLHAGGSAFGMCDAVHRRPCSYFTVLRDPLRQAASSYRHCQTSLADPQCSVINANDVTLRDWVVLHGGGSLFEKFLFNSKVCQRNLTDIVAQRDVDTRATILVISPNRVPCWYKLRVWVRTLVEADRRMLLDYVLSNLERFFASLGLYEDMDATLRTFEHVYGLPFSECGGAALSRPREPAANFASDRDTTHALTAGEEHALRGDPLVQHALFYDFQIYERVRQIVSEQNRRLFNRLT